MIAGKDGSIQELFPAKAVCFKKIACMLSGPVDIFMSDFKRRFLTPLSVITISEMEG